MRPYAMLCHAMLCCPALYAMLCYAKAITEAVRVNATVTKLSLHNNSLDEQPGFQQHENAPSAAPGAAAAAASSRAALPADMDLAGATIAGAAPAKAASEVDAAKAQAAAVEKAKKDAEDWFASDG